MSDSQPLTGDKPKTVVVNLRNEPADVFVARPSFWGNPYKIGRDGTRKQVVDKYATLIERKMKLGMLTRETIQKKLGGKKLGCFCAPEICHGDVLAIIANNEDVEET